MPEGLLEALQGLEAEVEQVGGERLRGAMREVWRRIEAVGRRGG